MLDIAQYGKMFFRQSIWITCGCYPLSTISGNLLL